ncbi:hypothetical protein Kuura_015 [Caulobacter phage Kuura]|nr:hypothetical protein Kuura_015 [Caulobacter phage Kuura]
MTIATFYADLKTAIGRGNSITGLLGGWVQQTLEAIETEHTYLFMETSSMVTVAVGASSNVVVMPVPKVKAFATIQRTEAQPDGTLLLGEALRGVSGLSDFSSIDKGYPTGYFVQGDNEIVLDAKATVEHILAVQYSTYTVWDDTPDSTTPPWLANRQGWLKAETLVTAAANLRDDRLAAIWQGAAQRYRMAAWEADKEKRWAHRNAMTMGQRR